ncbi:hypothetical protein [uncultured Tateyamaria sp.]|uniref:hypothetical protein n=1 Tax=uncultured Tateyamaria sp. TaxID=455651 RepID=UPI002607F0F4|nr:hypothetical protein [uncultured Tateyamaria sp.]
MIHTDECDTVAGGDGSWSLVDQDGRTEAYLPAEFAAKAAAATPLLQLMADAYNRGHAQGLDAGQRSLQIQFRTLMDLSAPDDEGGGR